MEEERIRDDAVFTSLDALHLVALGLDGHVLVNDADAAFACHGDRHFALGDGIHGRAHQRDVERDFVCQAGLEGNGAREYLALLRDEKDVVKSQAFVSDFVRDHVVRHRKYLPFLHQLIVYGIRAAETPDHRVNDDNFCYYTVYAPQSQSGKSTKFRRRNWRILHLPAQERQRLPDPVPSSD